MTTKRTGFREDIQGLARKALNRVAPNIGEEAAKPQAPTPIYVGASGKPNFARRNG